jgi:glucose/arabinose dehydrogenase
MDGMAQPVHYWTPSIAPSGLAIYEGSLFPDWRGDLLLGALAAQQLRRLDLPADAAGGPVLAEHRVFPEIATRVRDVRVGPEGALYVLTPDRVLRVTPARDE